MRNRICEPSTKHGLVVRSSLIRLDRSRVPLMVVFLAVSVSLGEVRVDEIQQASDKLFAALKLKDALCPGDVEMLRPSRHLLCGKTNMHATEFKRQVDAILADPENLGVVAVAKGEWNETNASDRQLYDIGQRFIEVFYYRYSGRVVITYPEYFAVCGTPGAPELVSVDSQPEGILPPVLQPATKKPPLFPEFARKARTEGRVVLQMVVGTDGVPKDICVVKGTGNGGLGFEYAAIQAAKNWRFEPARRDGQPVESTTTLQIYFTLR